MKTIAEAHAWLTSNPYATYIPVNLEEYQALAKLIHAHAKSQEHLPLADEHGRPLLFGLPLVVVEEEKK